MDDTKLKQFKKIYLETGIHAGDPDKSWKAIVNRLPAQEKSPVKKQIRYQYRYLFAGMLTILLAGAGTIFAAQVSRPGEQLYTVKVLSDKVVSKVLRKPQYNVERRAKDFIEVSSSEKTAEKAAEDYQKALEQAKTDISSGEKAEKEEFKTSLKKQSERLRDVHPESPRAKELLENAASKTEEVRREVRSASVSAKPTQPAVPTGSEEQNEDNTEKKNGKTKEN